MDSGNMRIPGWKGLPILLFISGPSATGYYDIKVNPPDLPTDILPYVQSARNSAIAARTVIPAEISFLEEWLQKKEAMNTAQLSSELKSLAAEPNPTPEEVSKQLEKIAKSS